MISLSVSNLRGPLVGPCALTVEHGTCAAIGGASGVGKSLFLRMVADLVPNEGDVRLGGERRADMDAPAWRRRVMYAGGTGWWVPTVADHIPRHAEARAVTLMCRLGMDADYLRRPVATLSTGEAQRLLLIRALLRSPRVLLLDEATSALDPANVSRVEELLRETLASGVILVLVTHDAAQAERLAHTRYLMSDGRLSPA